MPLLDLVGELTGMLPGLSPILAQTYINRALTSIYGERNWAFLVTDGVLVCPTLVSDGTASITQFSANVTLDAAASAAIAPQLAPGAVPGIQQLQFRPQSTSPAAGQLYSILTFDDTVPAAVVLTLDRVIQELTNATAEYQIYRAYVTPPIADFKSWQSLVDLANAITLSGQRLTVTSAEFDLRDPQRTAFGLAYWLGSWGGNRSILSSPSTGPTTPNATVLQGTPIYEFWPHPTSGQTWYCRFRRKGPVLEDPSDAPPPGISDHLIIQRALFSSAYPFAQANVGNFPSFKGANWTALILGARSEYTRELLEAKRNDDEQQLQTVWNRGHGLRSTMPFGRDAAPGYPIDSNFLQSHLIRF